MLTVLGIVILTQPAGAQPLAPAAPESVGMSTARLERVGQAFRAEIEAGRLPGAVVAIARKGKLVYHEAFGFVDRAAGTPMPLDAIFNLASMTKPLTAVGALILYEEGRLLLNDTVGVYLPQLDKMQVAVMSADGATVAGAEPAARKPTLQDLMRHTAGLSYITPGAGDLNKRYEELDLDLTSAGFIAKLGALPLHFQPGTRWGYGYGLDVLGLVIEAVSGQTLGRHLQEHLFAPLGMKDTGFLVPEAKASRYARPLPRDSVTGAAQSLPDLTRPLAMECGGGCGVSTAIDYLRFAQMLLNRGSLGDRRVLGRKSVEFMTADQLGPGVNVDSLWQFFPSLNGYGFGLGVAVRRRTGVAGVMGSPGDFSWSGSDGTYFWVSPTEELAVVFMSAAPGAVRRRHQQLLPALVLQAITD